jgi:ADP-ribose pyrophosphatase YjhB (NUDIX family)
VADGADSRADLQACAGGIVFDDAHRLLLVKRGRAPSAGTWSVPGGRCMPGEPADQACVREIAEETGLDVRIVRPAGSVLREGSGGVGYAIDDFVCAVIGGTLAAGDDADDVRWASRADLDELTLVPGLAEVLDEWGLLPD